MSKCKFLFKQLLTKTGTYKTCPLHVTNQNGAMIDTYFTLLSTQA